jgi:hypothetical protein
MSALSNRLMLRVERGLRRCVRLRLVETADDLVQRMVGTSEGARPERDTRDEQADLAELLVLHRGSPRPATVPVVFMIAAATLH